MIIVANKIDLETERVVSKLQGQELANLFECPFIEVSALNRTNIDEIFFNVIHQIQQNPPNPPPIREERRCVLL